MKKIGVIMATYNGDKYLYDQIKSIVSQKIDDLTIFIHDDKSTDTTLNVIKKCKEEFKSIKIVLILGEKANGSKNNFMYIMKYVSNFNIDYFFFADQDDVWLPDKANIMLNRMYTIEDRNRPCVIFSDMKVVDENLKILSSSFFDYIGADYTRTKPNQLIMQSFIAGCSMLINKKALDMSNLYSNINNIFMHDWWICLVASYIGIIDCVNEPLVLYRQHSNNVIGATPLKVRDLIQHLFETFFGNHASEIKERIARSRKFATELKKLPGLSEKQRIFLEEFSRLEERNKFRRIMFYKKYNLSRNNHRNWFFMLFV